MEERQKILRSMYWWLWSRGRLRVGRAGKGGGEGRGKNIGIGCLRSLCRGEGWVGGNLPYLLLRLITWEIIFYTIRRRMAVRISLRRLLFCGSQITGRCWCSPFRRGIVTAGR